MSSIKLSYAVYVGQDPNKKPLVVEPHQDTQTRQLAGKPTCDDDVIMHLCALRDPFGRGGEGREGRETPKSIPYVRLPDPLG